ncbi:hypothetical protein PV683_41665 [Streptomyces sp. AK08-01B]|uniref:hypothetical protein n=1 Tax=Streptomyces sp. AK08-01B TaxID=3028653 RepID=UPI0029AE9DF5|nr:hypothetical protein [Streptomyces sp. AK08-01B]MDX3772082.1 hypothetical protein [Streptomyces sp. AK08-01B]
MALRMEWSMEGSFFGAAGQTVRDVQEAVYWLDRSVARVQERLNLTPFESDRLGQCARLMRARMLDEADSATSCGKQWSATVGVLSMTLTPTG